MLVGYARVSTRDRNALQLDALRRANVKRIFEGDGVWRSARSTAACRRLDYVRRATPSSSRSSIGSAARSNS